MKKNFIGTRKHGWEIDNENKIITIFSPRSLYEKITNKVKGTIVIHFDDIERLNISYTSPIPPGAYHVAYHLVAISIKAVNGECIEFEAMSDTTKREDLINSLKLLNNSGIKINDRYDIIDKIMNSKETIWDILENIDKGK